MYASDLVKASVCINSYQTMPISREKYPVTQLVHSVNVPPDWSSTERFERPNYNNRLLVLSTLECIVIHLFHTDSLRANKTTICNRRSNYALWEYTSEPCHAKTGLQNIVSII